MLGVEDYGAFVAAVIVFLAIPGVGNLAIITSTGKGGIAGGLAATLGVSPGSVTPFALINDVAARVDVVLDRRMMAHERLNYHPLENTATTNIARDDLLRFIRETGHEPKALGLETLGLAST